MELVFTTVAVIGGMTFSLAVAILVEELIFGKVLGVFFAPRAPQPKTGPAMTPALGRRMEPLPACAGQFLMLVLKQDQDEGLAHADREACDGRTQTVPERSPEPCAVQLIIRASLPHPRHAYATPFTVCQLPLVCPGSAAAVPANAQNWAGAEEQLAGKIVAVTGAKTIALEVLNRSSLSAATTDDIRRNLLTQLAVLGVRFVAGRTGRRDRAGFAFRRPAKLRLDRGNSPGRESACDRHGFSAAICSATGRARSRGDGAAQNSIVVAAGAHSGCCGHRRQSGAHVGAGCEWRDLVPPSGQPLAAGAIASRSSTPGRGRAICGEGWYWARSKTSFLMPTCPVSIVEARRARLRR